MSLLFLYPGQGSQRPGMLHGLPRSPAVDRTLGEAADVLGDLAGLDTLKELQTTTSAQLALLIVGVADVRGRCVRDNPDAVLDDLAQAVAHPVHWYDATRLAAELGATCAVQMPPGHVLTDLLAAAAPAIGAVSIDDHDFRRAAARIRRTLRRTP